MSEYAIRSPGRATTVVGIRRTSICESEGAVARAYPRRTPGASAAWHRATCPHRTSRQPNAVRANARVSGNVGQARRSAGRRPRSHSGSSRAPRRAGGSGRACPETRPSARCDGDARRRGLPVRVPGRVARRVARLIVIDAGVAIAALAADDTRHEAACAALAGATSDELVLAATTRAEILVGPARPGSAARHWRAHGTSSTGAQRSPSPRRSPTARRT